MQTRKVIKIERTPCGLMPAVTATADGKAVMDGEPEWSLVDAKTPATLTVSSKTDDKSRQWTAKLEMTVCQRRYDILTHYAYRLTQADGSRLLMGSKERPYAIAEEQLELTGGNSKSQMLTVTVTLTTTGPLLSV